MSVGKQRATAEITSPNMIQSVQSSVRLTSAANRFLRARKRLRGLVSPLGQSNKPFIINCNIAQQLKHY
jgi:hypothetical protein